MLSPKEGGSAFALSNGVHFPIRDQDNTIFCRVTYEALAELQGCDQTMLPDMALKIFEAHRSAIEGKAAELHARGLRIVIITNGMLQNRSARHRAAEE